MSKYDKLRKQILDGRSDSNIDFYKTVICWSETDNIFVAEIPDLSGCAAHGKTPAEALQNVMTAIELWLETAREFGDGIPQPRQHQLAA